jgi:hypothetical protein
MAVLSRPIIPARFSEFRLAIDGAYHPDSPEYLYSRTRVSVPWHYLKVFIRYEFQCYPGTKRDFHVGRIITISLRGTGLNSDHLAYYALVRDIKEFTTSTTFPRVSYHVTVEAHTTPGYAVKWNETVPWPEPFPDAIFALPHCFAHDSYIMEPMESVDEKDIIIVSLCLETARTRAVEEHHSPRPATTAHLSPPDVYHPSSCITSYPVFLSDHTLPLDAMAIPEGVEEIDCNMPCTPAPSDEDSEHGNTSADFSCIIEGYDDEEVTSKDSGNGIDATIAPPCQESVDRTSFMESGEHVLVFSIQNRDNGSSPSATTVVETHHPRSPLLPRSPLICAPLTRTPELPPIPTSLPTPPRLRRARSFFDAPRAVTKSGADDWTYSNGPMY